ncbi:MAG: hypothetical protein JJT75_05330, partial [Opitutales bacterium]|nr:hypothetical protein [Opitutales bacterium]
LRRGLDGASLGPSDCPSGILSDDQTPFGVLVPSWWVFIPMGTIKGLGQAFPVFESGAQEGIGRRFAWSFGLPFGHPV